MACCCCCSSCGASFEPDDPALATSSRFLPQPMFICYKVLLLIYFIFWCIWWPVEENIDTAYQFVTYWTFYITALYFLASTTTAFTLGGHREPPRASHGPVRGTHGTGGTHHLSSFSVFLLRFQIFSWNVACVGSLVVVLVFWGLLFEGGTLTSTDINAHIIIAVIMAVDQLLVATKFERSQMWATFSFGLTYIIFNVIWFVSSPENSRVIYSILDWGDNLGGAILAAALILFALVPIFGLVHYGVFRLRECLYASGKKGHHSRGGDIETGRVVATGSR